MSLSFPSEGNEVKKFQAEIFREYVRGNEFAPDMGTSPNSIIQVNKDLTRERGKTIGFSLVARLTGSGVTGSTTLEGAEEKLDDFNMDLKVEQRRNAVLVSARDQQYTNIDYLREARPVLVNWLLEKTREDILIKGLTSIGLDANGAPIPYAGAAAGLLNTWQDAQDGTTASVKPRVIYGDALSNISAGDHAASLTAVTSGMTLSYALVSFYKRVAKQLVPKIRPAMVKTKDGTIVETFKMYVPSDAFRDLEIDMQQNHREAMNRGKENPLFRDGDIMVKDVIVREIPEMAKASPTIAQCVLCGAQAVGVGYAQMPNAIGETRDYGDKRGVGIREHVGFSKLVYERETGENLDHGILTAFVYAADDS